MFGGVTTAAQLMVKVGADVSDAQSKLRGMSSTFSQFSRSAMQIGGAMTLGITTPLVTAGLAVTKFASDLSESTNKAQVVFGEQAAAIEQWSEASAKAFGMSRQQALDAAGTFGNLFTSMELTRGQSAQMSQGLVQLAADLASFNNIDPGVALEKLRAGMVGEVEPLRTLGISLSAAAVEAKAFEMGLAATAAELTEADKAAARYALILEQSSNAQGDFARTADGLANQTRIVKAQLADAAATLGAQLLPYVQKLVEFVSQVLTGFTNLDPQIQTFIMGIAAVAAALGPAVAILGVMGTAIGALISPIGLVVAAIVGLSAVVVNHFGGMQGTIDAAAKVWTNTLQPALATVWEFVQSNVIPILQTLATVYIALVKKELELLASIWTNVLQPALATVWDFIQSNVIPILENLATVYIALVKNELELLASIWTNVLQPALATVWDFIQSNIIPILENLATVYIVLVKKELQLLADIWTNILLPAVTKVWEFLQSFVIPLLGALANVYVALVKKELELLAAIWQNILLPAITKVWEFIQSNVIPVLSELARIAKEVVGQAFETLSSIVKDNIGPALSWFKDSVVDPVAGAISAIGSAISGVIGWLNQLADKLAGMKLPSWLTPGSPTPFELGLLGINRALRTAAGDGLPAFTLSLENLGEIIKEVVEIFRQLAGYFADPTKGIEGAKAVTDALEPIFKNLVGIIDGLNAVLDMGDLSGLSAKVDAAIVVFTTDLPRLVAAFVDVAKLFKSDALAAAVVFADAAAKITAPLRAMVDAFTAVAAWVPAGLGAAFAGLLSQLRGLARLWKTAANGFDEDMLEGALWFSSIAGALVAPLKAMVDAFTAVASWVPAGLGAAIAGLLSQLRGLARLWKTAANGFNADMLEGALWFANIAGALVAPLKAMVDGFTAVADYKPAAIGPILNTLFDQLRGMVRKLVRLAAEFDQEGLAAAAALAESAGAIADQLKAMVDGFTAVAGYKPETIGPILNTLFDQLRGMVRKLVRLAAEFDQAGLAAAAAFAESVSAMLSMLSDALDLLTKIKTYVSPSANALLAFERDVEDMLLRFTRWVVFVIQPIAASIDREAMMAMEDMVNALAAALEILDGLVDYVAPSAAAITAFQTDYQLMFQNWVTWATTTFADLNTELVDALAAVFGNVFSGIGTAVTTLTALSQYVSPGLVAITAFETDYQLMFTNWVTWATTTFADLNMELVTALSSVFGNVFSGIGTAVTTLTALSQYVSPGLVAITAFETDYQLMFTNWVTWATTTFADLNMELVTALSSVFGSVFSGIGAAVATLTALSQYVSPSAAAITAFETDYQLMFTNWVTWATTTFADLNAELVAAVASVFGNVFSGIGAAVATLTALSQYVSPGETAISAFESDYQRLFSGFVTWVETTFTDISSDLVVAMAGAASALFTGLGAAATTLSQITGYIGPTDATIAAFEADYQRIATGFATWAESSWTEEMAATTTAVGNAVTALFTGLGTAATVLSQIRNYTAPSQAVVDQFITDMTGVISTMLAWAQTSFGEDAQELMTSFGTTIDTLFEGIGTALTVLQGIADYTVTNSEFVLALQRFNDNLLTAITSWQIWLTDTFTPETAELVRQFHTILSGIVEDMTAALNLLMAIDQAQLPTSEELQAFLDSVADLFDGIILLFGDLETDLGDLVLNLIVAFGDIFTTISDSAAQFSAQMYGAFAGMFDDLNTRMYDWGALSAGHFMSGLLVGMQHISSVNAVVNAMRDLAEQLEAELRAAWGIGSPSKVAERLGGFFVSGLARGLEDLDQIPAMIQRSLAMDGVTLGADVRYSPAPRHDYLTVAFEGAWQTGMSPAEEKRITSAMVGELRRQGLALQVARV